MILRLPSYYKEFSCIADRCQDSCCVGWEIDIDDETFAYYKSISGPFGERLRANMTSGEMNSFRLKKGSRCPFLNERGLCDIVLTLGETSLCEICTEYPRFTLEYADVREKCLGISCEEVGRILFEKEDPVTFDETVIEEEYEMEAVWEEPEDTWSEEPENLQVFYDREDASDDCDEVETLTAHWLGLARDHGISILQDRSLPIEERICRCLTFSEKVQAELNDENWEAMELLLQDSENFASAEEPEEAFAERKQVLDGMEILDEEWRDAIRHVEEVYAQRNKAERHELIRSFMDFYRSREYEYEHLMVYFLFRYIMKAVFDGRFLSRVQLAVLSFLTIRDLDVVRYLDSGDFTKADRVDTARIYSKEVEHSEDNLEYLAEEFVFTDSVSPEQLRRQVRLGL